MFVAGVVFAQVVSLFPVISVTEEQRAAAVWAICYLDDYPSWYVIEYGGDEEAAWADDAAQWAFYRQRLLKRMRRLWQIAKDKDARSALPSPDSYDPGFGGEG
jgi:hypothetical protein